MARKLSVGDYENAIKKPDTFKTPSGQNFSTVKMGLKKLRCTRSRLSSLSPNINSIVLQSPDCSPIVGENVTLFNNMSLSPCMVFSPRSPNQITQSESEDGRFNLSYLNKSISIENILKSQNMEKYIKIFHKNGIDSLAVFASLTEQDLAEIGISTKNDRFMILEAVAAYKGEV